MVNDLIAGVAAGFRSSRRGLSIADLVDTLQSLSVEDAADALTQMPDARAVAVLDSPELRSAADILAHLTPARAAALVSQMAEDRAADVLTDMDEDDALAIRAELPAPVVASIAEFGDALMRAGFRNPVVDRDVAVHWHPDMASLMREQRAIGATNALSARRRALTGRARFEAAAGHYEQFRTERGLPASWEWITAMAWSPKHGAPIREGDEELARFDASAIPVRRRSTD